MKTIIALLLVGCVVSLAQTNTNNSDSSLDKNAPFNTTAQLMNAAQYGGTAEIVKVLLEKGADINAKDNDGWGRASLFSVNS
jgi:ankyrin repeat protein